MLALVFLKINGIERIKLSDLHSRFHQALWVDNLLTHLHGWFWTFQWALKVRCLHLLPWVTDHWRPLFLLIVHQIRWVNFLVVGKRTREIFIWHYLVVTVTELTPITMRFRLGAPFLASFLVLISLLKFRSKACFNPALDVLLLLRFLND